MASRGISHTANSCIVVNLKYWVDTAHISTWQGMCLHHSPKASQSMIHSLELSPSMEYITSQLRIMLASESKDIISSSKMVQRPTTQSEIIWLSRRSKPPECCRQIPQLLPSGSLIQLTTFMVTVRLVATSMDFGMRSRRTLMGHLPQWMFAPWVTLQDWLTTTLPIPISGLVSESSSWHQDGIPASQLETIVQQTDHGLRTLQCSQSFPTLLSTKILKMEFWLRKQATSFLIISSQHKIITVELSSILPTTPSNPQQSITQSSQVCPRPMLMLTQPTTPQTCQLSSLVKLALIA